MTQRIERLKSAIRPFERLPSRARTGRPVTQLFHPVIISVGEALLAQSFHGFIRPHELEAVDERMRQQKF